MRILHLTTHLNPGGITQYVYSLAVSLKNKGHQVLAASGPGKTEDLFIQEGIKRIAIPICTKQEISLGVLFSYFILKKYLLNNRVDVIHAHTRVTQVLGQWLSKRLKIPLVTTCHGFFKERFNRRLFPCWGNKVIAISSAVSRHLIDDFGVDKEKVVLVHSGIDLKKVKGYSPEEIIKIKKEIGIPLGSPVIASIARFSVVKGLEYLIRALGELLKNNDKIVLLLIGTGKEEGRLKQLAGNLGVEKNVIFCHPARDVRKYFCVMDVFVMPSLQEGLGLSILEAQAFRVPVIASRIGGIPDIIKDRVTGLLIEPKDFTGISSLVEELLRDKELYSKIQAGAYQEVIKSFSLERMAGEVEEVYRKAINEK